MIAFSSKQFCKDHIMLMNQTVVDVTNSFFTFIQRKNNCPYSHPIQKQDRQHIGNIHVFASRICHILSFNYESKYLNMKTLRACLFLKKV